MKILNTRNYYFTIVIITLFTGSCFAQEGSVVINQDKEITQLLNLKTEMNTSEDVSDRYKIQIYSGNRPEAEDAIKSFKGLHLELSSKLVYETPNYKVWVGNFRTQLEADRALVKVKKEFPTAFKFKPKKKKE